MFVPMPPVVLARLWRDDDKRSSAFIGPVEPPMVRWVRTGSKPDTPFDWAPVGKQMDLPL